MDLTIAAVPAAEVAAYEAALLARPSAANGARTGPEDGSPPDTLRMPDAPPRPTPGEAGGGLTSPPPLKSVAADPLRQNESVSAAAESNAGPGFVTRAAGGALAGAQAMGRFGSIVLRGAGTVDRFLTGKRVPLLVGVSTFVVLAPWLDTRRSQTLSILSVIAFLGVVAFFCLARIDAFRDDSGWHASLVLRTAREFVEAFRDWVQRIGHAAPAQTLTDLGKPLLFGGLLSGAFANAATTIGIDDDVAAALQDAGICGLGFGVAALVASGVLLRRRAKTTGCRLDPAGLSTAQSAVNSLPLVLDCGDATAVASAADGAKHPLVAGLLRELAKPWPRPYYDDEREYQTRLLKRLRMTMPEANPRSEKWIGEQERADLLVGDERAGVLIEMKVRANSSALQRLVGQAWQYLRVWHGRGPMLLVLCKTSSDVKPRLEADIALMRQQGHAVLAVLAAP
jgi:hypothetical protein